ncbi:MAG: 3-hydroxyacyl-ACP dehydratase FabZ [Aquificaceae bacterium]|nr:3-hydroxyacyl-ACP dehydratase FabZ [Aquificaceae bacterium]MDW8237211.1 3-hydroxyacyl-ACP dehydratase FabZ [Aquificaceae bacterium]
MLSIHEIMKILPHRYPLLLVDKVLDIKPGERIKALKCVSVNEPVFQGHFPSFPMMPGVYILEAMAQAGGILMIVSLNLNTEKTGIFFAGVEEARFRMPVFPGDRLILELEAISLKKSLSKMRAKASVDETLVAEATLMAVARDIEQIAKRP